MCVISEGNVTTRSTYDGPESERKDLGQFYRTDETGHLCWPLQLRWRLEVEFVQLLIIVYERKVSVKTTETQHPRSW